MIEIYGANVPEQLKMPRMVEEFDRLYLEKCQEVNELERKAEHYREMAMEAVRQRREKEKQLEEAKQTIRELAAETVTTELISKEKALAAVEMARNVIIPMSVVLSHEAAGEVLAIFNTRMDRVKELINEIPAASTIRELAEPLNGFIPDVEPPEELPEELMEELPLWALQPVTAQDILCLSSALKNLYEIHKCDSWLLYNRLTKVLEKKIEEYCGED